MSKRGRRKKEEYYLTKKVDSVDEYDNVFIIHLPVKIEDCLKDISLNSHIEILKQTNIITGYVPEKTGIEFSEITGVKQVTEIKSTLIQETKKSNTYDISIGKKQPISITEISCWWCCHSFNNTPISYPDTLVRDVYKVKGIFCSYACCYSYMKDKKKDLWLLNYMFKDHTKLKGVIRDHITPAPPREALIMFGGPLSIEDFRKTEKDYCINNSPMTYIPRVLEEIINTEKPKKQQIVCGTSLGKFLNLK